MTGFPNMLADLSGTSGEVFGVSSALLIRMAVLLAMGCVIAVCLSFVVRSLKFGSAVVGGMFGGALAAGGFLLATPQFGEMTAYLVAAALLCLAMTLMIAHARPHAAAKADGKKAAATSQPAASPAPAASRAAPKPDPKPDPKSDPDPAPSAQSPSAPAPKKEPAPEKAPAPEPATPPAPESKSVAQDAASAPPPKDKTAPKAAQKPSGMPKAKPKSSGSTSPAWMQDH